MISLVCTQQARFRPLASGATRLYHLALVIMSLCLAASFSEGAALSEEEIPGFMETIAGQIKMNYTRIRTWHGTMSVEDTENYYDEQARRYLELTKARNASGCSRITKRRSAEVTFALDIDKDALFCDFDAPPAQHFNLITETPIDMRDARFWERTIRKSDGLLRFEPNMKCGVQKDIYPRYEVRSRAAHRESVEKTKPMSKTLGTLVDPRAFFADGRYIWEKLERVAGYIKSNGPIVVGGHRLSISVSGSKDAELIVLRLPLGKGKEVRFFEMTFDQGVGGNCVLYDIKDMEGNIIQHREIEYKKVDGIFVPRKFRRILRSKDGKRVTFDRKIVIKESEVNSTLDLDQFTWKALGLKEGDRFVDHIAGIEYLVSNGQLVSPTGLVFGEEGVRVTPPPVPSSITADAPSFPDLVKEESIEVKNSADIRNVNQSQPPLRKAAAGEKQLRKWLIWVGISVVAISVMGGLIWALRRRRTST